MKEDFHEEKILEKKLNYEKFLKSSFRLFSSVVETGT